MTFALLLSFSSQLWANETLRITILGVTGSALQNVQHRLNATEQSYSNLTTENIQALVSTAPKNIQQALEPFGYFKVKVQSNLRHDTKGWIAEFNITPGPRMLISKVDVKISGPGKDNVEIQKFVTDFPLKAQQPLEIEHYEKAIQSLFEIANNQGYIKANIEKKEIRIDLKSYTAVIIIHLNTSEQYYFGDVTFSNSPYSQKFLQRFVTFNQQQPFSSQTLLKFQQDLSNSQYFQQVSVNPDLQNIKNLNVPIQVDTQARKSQQYNFGLGYGTFTGPRFTAGVDWRRVTDTGQHLNTQLKLSPVLSGLAAKYFIPGREPLTEQYTIGANYQAFYPKNGRSISETLAGSYVKSINEWQYTLSLNYLRERFSLIDNPWQSSNLLYPSFNISRIKYDNLTDPHFGSAVNFNLQGSSDRLLSQINFVQSEIKAKWIYSPTPASRILIRGAVGYTTVKDLQKLPLTLQFYAGGPNSVRGYRFDSMGPGRYLKEGSIEFQHKIYHEWYGSVFYDAGIATNHFSDPYQHSRGVGLIYRSLIGPIRVYVSRAESTPGKPLRVEFNIGPDF